MKQTSFIYLIGASILLLLVCSSYGFEYSLIAAKSAEVNALAQKIADQNQSASRLSRAKVRLAALTTQESTLDQYFVSTSSVVPFLEQIQSLGKYLGATVQVVSVSADPGTPFGTLTLSLNITGSFDSIARTIGAIEYEPYDTSIKTFSMDQSHVSGAAATSTLQWTAAAVFIIGAQTGTTTPATTP